jgi:putative heme-binding domain-containing protein
LSEQAGESANPGSSVKPGASVRIEVVDGCGLDAYAWIGISEISEPGLANSSLGESFKSLVRLAQCYGNSVYSKERKSNDSKQKSAQTSATQAAPFLTQWRRLLESNKLDALCKVQLQSSVAGLDFPPLSDLVQLIIENGAEDLLADRSQSGAAGWKYRWDWENVDQDSLNALAEAFGKRANAPVQEQLIKKWAPHRSALPLIERLIRRGALSKDSLRALPPSWWDALPADESARFADLKPDAQNDSQRDLFVLQKAHTISQLTPDIAIGKRVFEERCATCHQLRGNGKLIGPQLDGAVVRTLERLCEDILWSNRNVDEAFRITNVQMDDGETISGLVLDRNDQTLEIIDQNGKSQRILRSGIEQEKVSKLSLMPSNFEELISDNELASLIGFLKTQTP